MKKQNYSLLLVLVASVLLSIFYIPGFNPLSGDKEIYQYIGRVMLKGGIPYKDVFDHKPPLIFFLNYAGLLMGSWGQWVIDTLLVLLATGLFFGLGRKYRLPYPWLLPLLFNLMLRDHLICIGMGMTREYTAVLFLLFFCVLLGKYRYRYFLLGLLSGLIFFMQQDQVLPLLPFFVYAFLPGADTVPFLTRFWRTGAGFLAVSLPIILYFSWVHSLTYFWRDAFVFNMSWYTTSIRESPGDHLRRVKRVLDAGNYEVPALVGMTLGISALLFRNSNRKLIFAALAAAVLSISPEFMGGRATAADFTHYYLPLAASLPVLLFCVFAFTEEPVFRVPRAQGIFGILVCASVGYTAIQHGTHLKSKMNDPAVRSPEWQYLRQHRPGNYQLYIFGHNDYIYAYNAFGILAPSPWVYQHFWTLYDKWDLDLGLLHSIGRDLLSHRTTYILEFTTPTWFRNPAAYAWWRGFLMENYEPVPMSSPTEYATLWKLKGTPD